MMWNEVAIFKVKEKNIEQVIALSLKLFREINSTDKLISTYDIFQKTDARDELCWQLTWVDQAAVKFVAERWKSYSSTIELESLVDEKIYYGHFVSLI